MKNLCVLVLWTKVASALEGVGMNGWQVCPFQWCFLMSNRRLHSRYEANIVVATDDNFVNHLSL